MASKPRPFMFIGSSSEGLSAAEAIQSNLNSVCECELWTQGAFDISKGTLESLVKKVQKCDFATLILTPDDLVESRGDSKVAPRDNVILELGLFIGGLGIERTFMVCEQGAKLKLPTDLAGITYATFQQPESSTMQAALGPACSAMKAAITELNGRFHSPVSITAGFHMDVKGRGVSFKVTNTGRKDFPPYSMQIFHPELGSFSVFPSQNSGVLLPDQERDHLCIVIARKSGESFDLRPWLSRFNTGEIDDFRFRLVLENSSKVLYENAKVGRAFATLVRSADSDGTFKNDTWDLWVEMQG